MSNPLRRLPPNHRDLVERALVAWLASPRPTGSLAALGLGVGWAQASRRAPLSDDVTVGLGGAVALDDDSLSRWRGSSTALLALAATGRAVVAHAGATLTPEEVRIAGELVRMGAPALVVAPTRLRAAPFVLAGWQLVDLEADAVVAGFELGRELAHVRTPTVIVLHHGAEAADPARLLRRRARRALEHATALPEATPRFELVIKPEDPQGPRRGTSTPLAAARSTLESLRETVLLAPAAQAQELEEWLTTNVLGTEHPEALAAELAAQGVHAIVVARDHDRLVVERPAPERTIAPIRFDDALKAFAALLEGEPVRLVVDSENRIPGDGSLTLHRTDGTDPSTILTWGMKGALITSELAAQLAGSFQPRRVELVQVDPIPEELAGALEGEDTILVVGDPVDPTGQRVAGWLSARGWASRARWLNPHRPVSLLVAVAKQLPLT